MLICMCMLNKRTHILFDQEFWNYLSKLAKMNDTSVGDLVRKAAKEKYAIKTDLDKKRKTVDSIMKLKEEYQRKHSKKTRKKESVITLVRKMREERTQHIWNVLKK